MMQNMQLLDILSGNSANKPSFQNLDFEAMA